MEIVTFYFFAVSHQTAASGFTRRGIVCHPCQGVTEYGNIRKQVPMNQPEAALDMLNHFVRNVSFDDDTPVLLEESILSSSSLPRKMAPVE